MDNLLELKEFEFITDNDEYRDEHDQRIHFLNQEKFKELDEFVRRQNGEKEDVDALDFFKSFSKRGVGNVIQARNYVGLVQLESGFQVQILPKIDMVDETNENHSTRHVLIDMLRCMKDFPGKIFTTANLRTESMNLYEIFINMYVVQVSELTKRGLKSTYVNTEDNLSVYKGKLIFNKHIKANLAHEERFYVSYDEYSQNRAENRLIKATLLKLQRLSTSSNNLKLIRQLLTYFELVDVSVNYDKDFAKVVIDRNTKDYESIMEWSKVFLTNKSFSTFSGDRKARALLFPMEKLYESYVAQKMEYIFAEVDLDVSVQDRKYHLFKEDKREVFGLQPDIVVSTIDTHTKKFRPFVIMDTKWKRLYDSPDNNYGISQADMYQMFAYSKKYDVKNIWLLYPFVEELRNHEPIVFRDGDKTEVNIFFVNVANIEESIRELLNRVQNQFEELMV